MDISYYQGLIAAAKEEINNCQNLIKETDEFSLDISNCVKELECVSNNLQHGLILDGVPLGSGVSEMKENLNGYSKSLDANIDALNSRIDELNKNIEGWNAEIVRLQEEAYRKDHPIRYHANKIFKK